MKRIREARGSGRRPAAVGSARAAGILAGLGLTTISRWQFANGGSMSDSDRSLILNILYACMGAF